MNRPFVTTEPLHPTRLRPAAATAAALAALLTLGSLCGPAGASDAAATIPLSVDDAVRIAQERNEALLIAIADKEKADARVKEAYSGVLPSLTFQGTYQRNFTKPAFFLPPELAQETGSAVKVEIGSDYEFNGELRLDQVLYAFGRVGNAVDYAKIYRKTAALGVGDARNTVAFSTKEAYYRVLLAEQVVGIHRRSLEQAEANLEEVQRKLSQGTVSRFDLLRAQVEVKNREPAVIGAENDLSLSMQDLKRILAMEDRPDPVLTDTLVYVPAEVDEDRAVEEAFAGRPEIQSLELNVTGMKKILAIEKANRLPTLGLFGQVLFQGQANDDPLDSFDSRHRAVSSAAGIALSLPIFDGFRTKAKIQQARADLAKAEHQLDQARNAVRLEVVKAVKDLEALRRAYEAQTATVSLAEETYAIAQTRFHNGLSTQLELTDADLALAQARVNYATTLYQYDVAVANLERALGRAAEIHSDEETRSGSDQEE
jgi:outer membrane protein